MAPRLPRAGCDDLAQENRQMKRIARRDLRNCLVLAALSIVAYFPALASVLSGGWPFVDDSMTLFNIWRILGNRGFEQGIVPLWNPYIFCGLPFFANNQNAILYPPNLVYVLLPMAWALLLDALFHNILLACGAYFLGRVWRLSRSASFVMALAFSLAGGVEAHIYMGHMTWHAVRAFLPWELALLTLYLRSGQKRWVIWMALCFALQVAAGYPPLVLVSASLCLALLATWFWQHRKLPQVRLPHGWPRAVALFLVLTSLLSALFVLPLAEMSRQSVHGDELDIGYATALSGSWTTLARLIAPGIFGNNNDVQWSLLRAPHEEVGYIGLFPLLLALAAPWLARGSTRQRPIWFLWCLLPFAAAMAMGRHLPLYGWVFEVFPPLRQTRVPARWMEIFYYGAALLSGFGFDFLVRYRRASEVAERRVGQVFGILCLLFILLVIAIVLTPPASPFWMQTVQSRMEGKNRFSLGIAEELHAAALAEALIVAAFAGATAFFWRRWRLADASQQRPLQLILIILIALDLTGLFWRSAKTASPKLLARYIFMPPELTRRYNPQERWNTEVSYGLMNQAATHGISIFSGYDALGTKRYFQFVAGLEGRFTWGALYEPSYHTPLLRVAGVTHTLTSPKEKSPSLSRKFPNYKPQFVAAHGEFKLWRWDGAWPRAYLTRRVVSPPEKNQLSALEKSAEAPQIVEGQLPVFIRPNTFADRIGQGTMQKGEGVLNWRQSFDRVTFQTVADYDSVLVFADTYYPGWKAFVNQKPVPIERVNFLFRGLVVPPGESQVEMLYEPQSYRLGMFLTLCGLSLLGFLGAAFITKNSQAKRRPELTRPN